MQKQLDTPSPYYEGFTKKSKGKFENSCLPFEITRINTDIFCFDGQRKEKTRYTPDIFFDWKCMDLKKLENQKKKFWNSYRDIFCFAILA